MRLLERYIERQTTDNFFWVVVDDVHDTNKPRRCNTFIRREPKWTSEGGHTMLKNLAIAFRHIEPMSPELILFIEDDDWYHPAYIETMQKRIMEVPQEISLIGENYHRYFNVALRVHMPNRNTAHAALCATGIRGSAIKTCIDYCENDIYQFFDFWLWKKSGLKGKLYEGDLCVGIKALPGRVGIGLGHYRIFASQRCRPDLDLEVLKSVIGEEDAKRYAGFCDTSEIKKLHEKRFHGLQKVRAEEIPLEWRQQSGHPPVMTHGEIHNQKNLPRHTPKKPKRSVKPIRINGPIERKKR
jgi:hypothetical protein